VNEKEKNWGDWNGLISPGYKGGEKGKGKLLGLIWVSSPENGGAVKSWRMPGCLGCPIPTLKGTHDPSGN